MPPVALEKIRQIQHRALQYSPADEVQGDQQAPHPAVAVQERVDGFKLIVHQGDFQQLGEILRVVVHEPLDIGYRLGDGGMHRRHENRIGGFQPVTFRCDDVFATADALRRKGVMLAGS